MTFLQNHEFLRSKMEQLKHYFFLHDNSANLEQLGVNIKGRQFWGDIRDTQEVHYIIYYYLQLLRQ